MTFHQIFANSGWKMLQPKWSRLTLILIVSVGFEIVWKRPNLRKRSKFAGIAVQDMLFLQCAQNFILILKKFLTF